MNVFVVVHRELYAAQYPHLKYQRLGSKGVNAALKSCASALSSASDSIQAFQSNRSGVFMRVTSTCLCYESRVKITRKSTILKGSPAKLDTEGDMVFHQVNHLPAVR
jgi:hypothetical protein